MDEFIAVELDCFGWGAAAASAGRFAFVSEGGKQRHFVFKQQLYYPANGPLRLWQLLPANTMPMQCLRLVFGFELHEYCVAVRHGSRISRHVNFRRSTLIHFRVKCDFIRRSYVTYFYLIVATVPLQKLPYTKKPP